MVEKAAEVVGACGGRFDERFSIVGVEVLAGGVEVGVAHEALDGAQQKKPALQVRPRALVLDSSDGRCAMRYPKSHPSTVVLLFVAIAVIACEPATEQPEPEEKATAEAELGFS